MPTIWNSKQQTNKNSNNKLEEKDFNMKGNNYYNKGNSKKEASCTKNSNYKKLMAS